MRRDGAEARTPGGRSAAAVKAIGNLRCTTIKIRRSLLSLSSSLCPVIRYGITEAGFRFKRFSHTAVKRPYMRARRPQVRTPTPILVKIGVCGGFGLKPHNATSFLTFVA